MTKTMELVKANYESRCNNIQENVVNNFRRMATEHEFKNNLKEKCVARHLKSAEKQYKEKLVFLSGVMAAELPEEITITVEWKSSRTWGMNPTAYAQVGYKRFESRSISGCGYCKESTAVAESLNQIEGVLRLLIEAYDNGVELPYGVVYYSGYPKFEGGVGPDCYWRTFEKLGYSCRTISSTKYTTVYQVRKV